MLTGRIFLTIKLGSFSRCSNGGKEAEATFTFPSLSKESKKIPTPFHMSADPKMGPSRPWFSVYQIACKLRTGRVSDWWHRHLDIYLKLKNDLTRPSAPIRPRPVTRNVTSISQFSKAAFVFVHTDPFWLLKDGTIRIWSELGIASRIKTGEKLYVIIR